MSDLYRVYGDNWASNPNVKDETADVSTQFSAVTEMMDEIKQLIDKSSASGSTLSEILVNDMAAAVFGSNRKARKGLGLDETIKLCMLIFNGEGPVDYPERYTYIFDVFETSC